MSLDPTAIRTDKCAKAFRRMFWAFLFFIDFRLGINNIHIDLIPDFIGWLIFGSSMAMILDLSPKVKTLRNLACILTLLALFNLVEIRITINQSGNMIRWVNAALPFNVVCSVVETIFIWKLCGLIMKMSSVVERSDLHYFADHLRKVFIGFTIVMLPTSTTMIFLASPIIIYIFVIITFIFMLVFMILMMLLIKKTEKMCQALPTDELIVGTGNE